MEIVLQWWEALIYVWVIILLGFAFGHWAGRKIDDGLWRTAYFNKKDDCEDLEIKNKYLEELLRIK